MEKVSPQENFCQYKVRALVTKKNYTGQEVE